MKKIVLLVTLLVISLSVGLVQAAPAAQEAGGETYTVQAGDWLSKLAEKYYGDIMAYPTIVEATNAKAGEDDSFTVIDNPDLIEPGQQLWIPATAERMLKVAAEVSVTDIALAGPITDRNAELSGMAWYGDYLILLPQYPNFATEEGDGFIFAIPKADLVAFLDGAGGEPLEPMQIPFVAPGLQESLTGFEGYEAIAFVGQNDVFLTIETETDDGMLGYLVAGSIESDLSALTVDTTTMLEIQPQSGVGNMSEESLLVAGDTLLTIYEANGVAVNASPVAHVSDMALAAAGTIAFPSVEYRITDVTALDGNDRFWAINYFFPGDSDLLPLTDPIANQHGEGPTHIPNPGVERLIELQYSPDGITLTGAAPIQMELLAEDLRNWEGLVRLDDRGFLVATDKYPQTILSFVPAGE